MRTILYSPESQADLAGIFAYLEGHSRVAGGTAEFGDRSLCTFLSARCELPGSGPGTVRGSRPRCGVQQYLKASDNLSGRAKREWAEDGNPVGATTGRLRRSVISELPKSEHFLCKTDKRVANRLNLDAKRIAIGSLLNQNRALSDHFEAAFERFGGQKVAQPVVIDRDNGVLVLHLSNSHAWGVRFV